MDYGSFVKSQGEIADVMASTGPSIVLIPQNKASMDAFGSNAHLSVLKVLDEDNHDPRVLAQQNRRVATDSYDHHAEFGFDATNPKRIVIHIRGTRDGSQHKTLYYDPATPIMQRNVTGSRGTHRVVLLPVQVES